MGTASSSKTEDVTSALLAPARCSEEGDERMGVDEMLQKYSGEFGPWQLRHFALVSLAWALDAFHTMVTIFADREPAWRCTGPACSDDVCQLEPGSWEWVGGREVSTVAEWGLVCGNKYKTGLVQSAFFAGCMVGCGIFGHLSDSFLGRKGSLMVGCIINTILGCLTAVSPSYTIYLILRVLTGLCTGPIGTTAFILATEPVGPAHRAVAGMSVFYFFSTGIVALAGTAYFFPSSWRTLYLITSLSTLFFIVAILPFISESPRWYLIRRKPAKALEIMGSIAKKNGRGSLSDRLSLVLDCDKSHSDADSIADIDDVVSGSIIDVMRSPLTRWRLALSMIVSFFCSVTYYGLTLNVVNLKTNLYINVIVDSVSAMPAFALATMLLGRFGPRPLAIGTMWFSGAFCIAGSLLGADGAMVVGRMVCGVFGIFGIAATYNLLLVYSAELFPTTVRNSALGCVQQAEQIGAVVAPMVVAIGQGLPFMVFGLCGIIGGVMSFYLPETFNQPLYDTMAGMEDGEKAREGA